MLAVEMGSSPEQGSSSMMISGSRARTRAIHSLCCCPPESRRAELDSGPSPHPRGPQPAGTSSTISSSRLFLADPLEAGPIGHILEDRKREGGGQVEDHPHPPAQLRKGNLRIIDLLAVDEDLAGVVRPEDQIGETVHALEQGRLPAPGRAQDGEDLIGPDGQVDLLQGRTDP